MAVANHIRELNTNYGKTSDRASRLGGQDVVDNDNGNSLLLMKFAGLPKCYSWALV